jgi:hypothetical protein
MQSRVLWRTAVMQTRAWCVSGVARALAAVCMPAPVLVVVFASALVRVVRCIAQAQARVVVCVRVPGAPYSRVPVWAVMHSIAQELLAGMWEPVVWPTVAGVSERVSARLQVTVSPSCAA